MSMKCNTVSIGDYFEKGFGITLPCTIVYPLEVSPTFPLIFYFGMTKRTLESQAGT
ncbi:Uncharacterized protein APZ42_017585 [Daphnia magna]|uniref:Uncharacterized protein n=1 Tax=Daphnia magna TaxID=35525 RepID=A0A164ZXY8_9CRUS|nr:Uncharacterized protein APZ42_017585 [Daphnia magna]